MNKYALLVPTLILVPFLAISQSFDYQTQLRTFKTCDFRSHSLDLRGNLDQSNSYRLNKIELADTLNESSKNRNFEHIFSLTPSFSRSNNSRKKIETINLQLDLSNNINNTSSENEKNLNNNQERKRHNLNIGIEGSYLNHLYYLQNDKHFLILGGSMQYGAFYNKLNDDLEEVKRKSFSMLNPLGLEATLGHGHGRIEYVDDMIEAIYIMKELSGNKQLIKEFDEKSLKSFADQITLMKNERYFDYRLYRQKSMKVLSEKLKELGLVDKESISIFNTIMDYHFQANFRERTSGQKIEYSLSPGFDYFLEEEQDGQTALKHNWIRSRIAAKVNYENSRPLSLAWQRSFNLKFRYQIQEDKETYDDGTEKEEDQYEENRIQLDGQYSLGYYPNTRTSIVSGIQASFFNLKTDINGWEGMGSLFSTINYYFSERLRLNVNLQLTYMGMKMNYQDANELTAPYWVIHNGFTTSINSSLIYSIF